MPAAPISSSWPRITVVTPSFNQGRFLERTMRSVLGQGYPNLEYIVVDGGSTDGSAEIIRRYADKLAWWCGEPDGGQAAAINKGFARASGEIFGWLNSDDLLLPGALARVGAAFSDARVRAACGWRVLIDGEDRTKGIYVYPPPTREVLLRRALLPQETVFWSRSLWQELGPLDESFRFALDFDYFVRMAERGVVPRLIPRFLGAFRVHDQQKTQAWEGVGAAEVAAIVRRVHGPNADPALVRKRLPRWWKLKLNVYRRLAAAGVIRPPSVAPDGGTLRGT